MAAMPTLSSDRLAAYRAETYHLRPDLRVLTREQAIDFVNRRGFVHFWPIQGVLLPSLWAAVAGERPVPNEHDDPGHVTWGWKDELLGARRWYYAKVLRKKATFIALDVAPYFYALSENYGEPEQDHLLQYQEGRMTFEAKAVYETLLAEGRSIRSACASRPGWAAGRASPASTARWSCCKPTSRSCPWAVAQAGAWKYAFVYDLVHRFYPDLPEQARPIRQAEARRRLVELYLQSVGAAPQKAVAALFGWAKGDATAAIEALAADHVILSGVSVEGEAGEWVALRTLF
jgi:hypothetical protein